MLDGLVMDVSSPGDIRPPPTNEWGWPYMQVGCLSLLTHPPTAWSAAVYCRPHSINGSLAPMDGLALAEVNSYTSDHRWYLGMVFCVALPGNHLETPFYGRLLSSLSPSGQGLLGDLWAAAGPGLASRHSCDHPVCFSVGGVSESEPATVETVQLYPWSCNHVLNPWGDRILGTSS